MTPVKKLESDGLSFDDGDIPCHVVFGADRNDAAEDEARGLEDGLPFALGAFFATSDGEHVEVAHQAAFERGIGAIDDGRQ